MENETKSVNMAGMNACMHERGRGRGRARAVHAQGIEGEIKNGQLLHRTRGGSTSTETMPTMNHPCMHACMHAPTPTASSFFGSSFVETRKITIFLN